MASLNKLAIRGIRSFDDKQIAVIEFFSPVTVIVGHNGSGKTTVIECLKYATTGDQPPNSRGGAFVHDPKMANEKEVKAQVKLRFTAANGQRMLAVRNLSVTVKKTAGLTMKTLESILSLADGNPSGKRATISTKCAEIDTEIPHLLGVSKAVLENVIFCHQEDSYWPLAEPAALKKKFDDIFEATRYTKALDSIKALRKERIADLKADKERLESLSKEKNYSDKLKARVNDLQSSISVKEMRHEKLREECDRLIATNTRFYESATKFREKYSEIQHLQNDVDRYTRDLEDAMEHVKEMSETDEQLAERRKNSDRYKKEAEQKLRREERRLQDTLDELEDARKSLLSLQQEHGGLEAEKKKHEKDIEDRDREIQRIAEQFHFKGFDRLPLERERIIAFKTQLDDMMKRSFGELEKLQGEAAAKNNEFKDKQASLHTDHRLLEQHRTSLQDQIGSLQRSITQSESTINKSRSLPRDLSSLQADIKEKNVRIEKIKDEIKSTLYEAKIQDASTKIRTLEEKRETLNVELKNLSLQSDARAKLDIKRADLKKKQQEVKDITEINNLNFRKLIGIDIRISTMERDVEQNISEKERDATEAEAEFNNANANAMHLESTSVNLVAQLKQKRDDLRVLERKLKDGLEDNITVQAALNEADAELVDRRSRLTTGEGTRQVYELLLKGGKNTKKCGACNRALGDHELGAFEKHLNEQMEKMSPDSQAEIQEEAEEWEREVKRLQIASDLAQEKLDEIRRELKELMVLKQQALSVSESNAASGRLQEEISRLEENLSSTGSVKTADEVQVELGDLSTEIRKLEREKNAFQNDREQQINRLRRQEDELHTIQFQEINLENKVKEHKALEEKVVAMHQEMKEAIERLKGLDEKIKTVLQPLERLQREHDLFKEGSNEKIKKAQEQCEHVRRSSDSLGRANKDIEAYIRNRRARELQRCEESIGTCEENVKKHEAMIEQIRNSKAEIEKEIHESDSFLSNLRDNERIRRLRRDIATNKEEIDAFDMEEAAKARRQFNDKYAAEKKREGDMEAEYSRLGGELNSLKDQLKTLEKDLSEFKDINKRYTDQLVKVKMSDMANNDLEKYAKALDNAIMKYHGLKMEEVNDTMRHLWNKTYQGTDIDGIKIRSDVEGGASKRSYNYRIFMWAQQVVMTKDQVEMDMRGRCSAGQKMLASIIIRLALSDSFGQNCGILALDEPTNALDVENIDALAGSLVDIIHERKNHANFQLIIITHDENFLRKLGQANVMEYYWRVSRDSRQKSLIERQRVG
ncbi:AAA domain-containing protein [Phellopilus nigrolimitatus]|nr:AAA domain-containing protein [Phellopilus nigrolimitatus]